VLLDVTGRDDVLLYCAHGFVEVITLMKTVAVSSILACCCAAPSRDIDLRTRLRSVDCLIERKHRTAALVNVPGCVFASKCFLSCIQGLDAAVC
jgi:hypothetical protein